MTYKTHSGRVAAENGESIGIEAEAPLDLMSLDTRNFAPARMEIINPVTKAGTGQYLWLLFNQHPKVQDFLNGEANAELRRDAERAARGEDPEVRTVEQGIERTVNLLCVATDRWENVSFDKEQNVTFTIPKARLLYRVPFVREQAVRFIKGIEHFTQG